VENRVGVARAANGGFSFLLDPLGNRISELVPPSGGAALGSVPLVQGTSLFTRTGDLAGPGALLALVLLLLSSLPGIRGATSAGDLPAPRWGTRGPGLPPSSG
jgi:apolipoprotein N-acyltransferase